MNSETAGNSKRDSQALAVERTDLAIDRTIMAAERSLLAWARTAMSLIGFGFTFYNLLQYIRQQGAAPLMRPNGPRNFGLALIAIGVFSLIVATVQYWSFVERLGRPRGRSPWTLALLVSVLMAMIGLFAIVNILFAMGPF